MTRTSAVNSQTVSVKTGKNSASLTKFISVVVLATFLAVTYFIVRKPESLPDPSDQFTVKNIPRFYMEGEDPDEREVFHGFRTSFLPVEDIVFARDKKKREVFEGNVTSDIVFWGSEAAKREPKRMKRMSRFTLTSKDYDQESNHERDEGGENSYEAENKSEIEEEYDSSNSDGSDHYEDSDSFESIVPPEMHVDRGPLDDVVEQVRGQPELEEGEMGSIPHLYKAPQFYKGIHAFWRGEGDKETIRSTQANIMRQYMDAEADPCHDFYQYACGNWHVLNPIPADKAGYDTFEMLRENLDSVLKDLLEFKQNEHVISYYPGPHLHIEKNFLKDHMFFIDKIIGSNDKEVKSSVGDIYKYEIDTKRNTTEILNRIRRYLDRKAKEMKKPITKLKKKFQGLIKNAKQRNRLNDKGMHKKVIVKRSLNLHNCNEEKKITTKRGFVAKQNNLKEKEIHNRAIVKRSLKPLKFKDKEMNTKRGFVTNTKKIRLGRRLLMFKRKDRKERSNKITQDVTIGDYLYTTEDPAHGDAALKARFLFKSCMNYEILEKRGHQPLIDLLDILGGWPILEPQWKSNDFDWLVLMARLRMYNNDILISEWVGPDIKNSDEFVIQFDQTSLGLPTRDYFLQDLNKIYLEAYKTYLIKIAILLGGETEHVEMSAKNLIDFEIRLAKITSAPDDRRNVSEIYNRMHIKKLEELVPEINWRRYLSIVMNRTVHSEETVVMFALSYVKNLVKLINETDPSTLSNYLLWRFVRHRVNNLDDRFQSAKQQFYYILFGREQSPARWKNCISQVNSNMGMALGSMFVKKYFDEISKNDTLTMTREIQQSFRELLHITDWIDDKTKKLAAHKVESMMLRIGYPDFIVHKSELDDRYKEVTIHPDKYFENILNILQHLTKMEQARIGQPVNKTLWNTAPAVVNAYYSRNKNQIMFPAGILQPPFYHRHFPRSLNYGGIGVVIGHEITHGFDDKGRLFDCDGNLHRWWSDSAIDSFHRRAQCLIDQYGQYAVPEVNVKVDGVNTQGENIADNGGVKQAFRAYLHWVKQHGTEGETLPGLNHTHTQLFFLNFAQVWCGAMRPEAMRNKLKTAVHSPGRFRVIGTLSNSHDFAREFRCPPGSPMNPVNKCTVW